MPRIDKTVFTNYVQTGCEKQLRINLHPTTKRHMPERTAIDLPMPQIRPAVGVLTEAGERWGWRKVAELDAAFGSSRLRGRNPRVVGSGAEAGLEFDAGDLDEYLPAVGVGDFIIEGSFPVGTPTFRTTHALHDVDVQGGQLPMDFENARPDIIEVLTADTATKMITVDGDLQPQPTDGRLALRVIDVKLNSEPGPKYFAEIAYYSLALAAWLEDRGYSDRFFVSADAAIWPGSEEQTSRILASRTPAARYQVLHETLEVAPMRVFLTEVTRLLRNLIPGVLARDYATLDWAVTPRCQGCENLGQHWFGEDSEPGDHASDFRPGHCIPRAKATDHLSRFPFLSRGSMQVLRTHNVDDVAEVASISPDHAAFRAHHRLRAQRHVIAERAEALTGNTVDPIDAATASTGALPRFSDLRLFLTADFDSATAITLAFGFSWAWIGKPQPTGIQKPRVHQVDAGTPAAEWVAFSALLDDIHDMLALGEKQKADATVQVYVWDDLTLDHLARVASRHLGRILADKKFQRLAWLFPPKEVIASYKISKTPAVSVVRDPIRSLVALPLAHNYSLLETARVYQDPTGQYMRTFSVPPFWSDPFSDQIPPERAHQMWTKANSKRYTHNDVVRDLGSTVRTKVNALTAVTDRIIHDLHGKLPRDAPLISDIHAPKDPGTVSVFGSLMIAHTRLDEALDELRVNRINALPLDEREARYDCAILEREISGPDRVAYLRSANLPQGKHIRVFELAEGSVDVRTKLNEMGWSVLPESQTHRSTYNYTRFMYSIGRRELIDGNEVRNSKYSTIAQIFGVSVLRIDKGARRLVLEFNTYHQKARDRVLNTGEIDLTKRLVLNPSYQDFLTKKVHESWKAIKNPPSTQDDQRIRDAIGMTRRPNTGPPHPAEHFIWNPNTIAREPVARPLDALRADLAARGRHLNDSQTAAWEAALTRRLTLIWGPPGTGKTATVRAILESLAFHSRQTRIRIGITAGTYAALDNVLRPFFHTIGQLAPDMNLRRLGRQGEQPSWLAQPQQHVTSEGTWRSGHQLLAESLHDSTESWIVGGTPQQMANVIEKSMGKGNLFDVLIIDEAGAMDVAHAMLAIRGVADGASIVLAGDPKQLPPIHQADPPEELRYLVGSIYDFYREWHQVTDERLLENYRSNDEIVRLSHAAGYDTNLRAVRPARRITYTDDGEALDLSGAPAGWAAGLAFSPGLLDIADPDRPVVCVTHPDRISGVWNQLEVDTVAATIYWYWLTLEAGVDGQHNPMTRDYFWSEAVGVVTPHRAQRSRIIERLVGLFSAARDPELIALISSAVDTVERFQGQERDIILASYAVGDPDTIAEEEEFLLGKHRFNVLATRARAKLIVVLSRELASHIGTDLDTLRDSELIKDFVDLFCSDSKPIDLQWFDDDALLHDVAAELRWHA